MRFILAKVTKNYYLYIEELGGINKHYVPKEKYPAGAPPFLRLDEVPLYE